MRDVSAFRGRGFRLVLQYMQVKRALNGGGMPASWEVKRMFVLSGPDQTWGEIRRRVALRVRELRKKVRT